MTDLIPDGYIALPDAISLIGVGLYGDGWQDLNLSTEESSARKRQKDHQRQSKVHRAKRASGKFASTPPDPLHREDQKLIIALEKREEEIEERRTEATNHLRLTLYSEQLRAYVLDESGSIVSIPSRIWFSAGVSTILSRGVAEFLVEEAGAIVLRKGRVLFSRGGLGSTSQRASSQSPTEGDSSLEDEFRFIEDEKRWKISFMSITKYLPDSINLARIAYLLKYPGKEITAIQLAELGKSDITQTAETLGNMSAKQLSGEGQNLFTSRFREDDKEDDDMDVLSDQASLKVYRNALELLKEEREKDVTLEGREEIDDKIEKIKKIIKEAKGVPGNPATFNDMSERARSTATSSINRGIGEVQRILPKLANHLDESISRGNTFCYNPEIFSSWNL